MTNVGPDYPGTIAACVVLSILGYVDALGMPIIVGALVDQIGFTEEQVGYIASADVGGLFAASVLTALLITRHNRRQIAAVGIMLAFASNLASTRYQSFEALLPLRFLAGAGGGAVYALVVAILAGSTHSSRNFTFLIFCIALTNAIIFYSFPIIASEWGVNGLFMTLATVVGGGVALLHLLPPYYRDSQRSKKITVAPAGAGQNSVPHTLPWLGLSAVFAFYFMIGAYWAYLERIGVHLGHTTEFVGKFLAGCTVLSLTGCILAYWISRKIGQSRPLIYSLGIVAATMLAFGTSVTTSLYFISTAVVFLFWNFIDIYQLGTLANLDRSGKYCALTPAAQGLAMTIAPAVAGALLGQGFGYSVIMYLGAGGTLFAFFAYSYVYARLKAIDTGLAVAS